MSRLRVAVFLVAALAAGEAAAQQSAGQGYYYRFRDDNAASAASPGGSTNGTSPGTAAGSGAAAAGQGSQPPAGATATISPNTASVASGGTLTLTGQTSLASPAWTVTGAPSWMVFNTSGSSYVFSGTAGSVPTTTTYPVTVTATSNGVSVSDTASVTVQAAPRQTGFPSGMVVRAGKPFSIPLTDPAFSGHTWNVSEYYSRISTPQIVNSVFSGTTSSSVASYGDTYSVTAFDERNDYYYGSMSVKPNITFNQYNNTVNIGGPVNQPIQGFYGQVSNAIGNLSYQIYNGQNLPAGLVFDGTKPSITGTPTVFGTYAVQVGAIDSYDNNFGQVYVNITIGLTQDIVFPNRMSTATYFEPFGTLPAGKMNPVTVTIRNGTNNTISLLSFNATGDSNDPEAFSFITGYYPDGHGGLTYTTSHSVVPTNPNPQYSVADYNHGQSNGSGAIIACAQYLSPGYYCNLSIGVRSSTTGPKTGSLSIPTQNNTSTIPMTATIQ